MIKKSTQCQTSKMLQLLHVVDYGKANKFAPSQTTMKQQTFGRRYLELISSLALSPKNKDGPNWDKFFIKRAPFKLCEILKDPKKGA